MNRMTTVALVGLVIVGGIFMAVFGLLRAVPARAGATQQALDHELTPKAITRVEVEYGDPHLTLEKGDGEAAEWGFPGKWPARQTESKELVSLLGGLHSRFATIPLDGDKALERCGLTDAQKPVQVKLTAGGKSYKLLFGEESGEGNRFSRATFLRLEDNKEAVRLAPGIVAVLKRPVDYYLKHQLFPDEKAAAGDDAGGKRLAAQELSASFKEGDKESKYTLVKNGADWQLKAPYADAVEPEKLKSVLTAAPDIWVEKFVSDAPTPKDLEKYGLKNPERTLTVTRAGVGPMKLLIGGLSDHEEVRTIPSPPDPTGMRPPMPPQTSIEKFRYAKLDSYDRIFEVRDGKLNALFVAPDQLRDPKLARFTPFDAKRVEITRDGKSIVLEKDKGDWKLKKPTEAEAEFTAVNDLLDKLSNLEAKSKDEIIDGGDDEKLGLKTPAATIVVDVEESKGEGDAGKTTKKTFTFQVGKRDEMKKKLYIRAGKWPRVNVVEDGLDKLVRRPALAYRGKRVLDFTSGDLAKLEVQRGDSTFRLEKDKEAWKLTAPEPAAADADKARKLVADLAGMTVVEYVTDTPKEEDLAKVYGLDKPSLTASVTYAKTKEGKPTTQKLLVGKARGDKAEYFARIDGKPEIFVVKKDIVESLEKGSLALLPQKLWDMPPAEIAELRVQKGKEERHLKREGPNWKILAPFEASAMPTLVDPILKDLGVLQSERYEALAPKELAPYGLDKPYLRVVLTPGKKEKPKLPPGIGPKEEPKEEPVKERVLLIGKPTKEGEKTRFAKLGDGEAVFVVNEKFVAAAEHDPLELLDRLLLMLEAGKITQIKTTAKDALTLDRKGAEWTLESPAAKFPADKDVMASMLAYYGRLRADKFVAYGPKLDLAKYGLDKPATTVRVTATQAGEKTETHTLAVGGLVDKGDGARYARLDEGPGIVVLPKDTVAELTHSYLDFADRGLLKFNGGEVKVVGRKMGDADFAVEKKDGRWQITAPKAEKADDADLDEFVQRLSGLRAERVAAYQPKELAAFGLDKPEAVWTFKTAADDKKPVILKVGKLAGKEPKEGEVADPEGDRFVQAEGGQTVGVLPGAIARRLVGPTLRFRDRTLAKFADADHAVLERGSRKATFAKVDGTWKLTAPTAAEAEQTDLDDFLNTLSTLRADELVAEKADLARYGLDKPELSWTFKLGDKEVLGLVVGNAEKSGLRRYAKLANGDIVFLLSPPMTTQALKEYRSRTVWPPFDAAQVDGAKYTYEGAKPFTLEKVGDFWTAGGKPVKGPRASETLDALARVKAERYMADKDADLTLYGLEPPYLTIEVQSRSGGPRMLHIGRAFGDSKRRYARVADAKRTDVFLISESDAAKIVRDAAGFAKE
jgi:hypothetical protein